MSFRPGDCLHGRYRIEALLGEGGMGAVYRAFDTLTDRFCAVKEFRLGYLPGENDLTRFHDTAEPLHADPKQPRVTREKAVEQFQREAKLLAKLEHPNLPKVTDYFAAGDDQYLVMTLIEGNDLAQILEKTRGAQPQDRVLGWMRQVLDALAYCHREGVVHRDVKPANIIVTAEGKAFLVDFGIAKPEAADGKTTIGARATTPGYSPPEQYGGYGQTDIRSDIYAAGATLYVLLTGQQPIDAIQRLEKEMPGVRRLRPDVSPRVENAILKALALRRDDRFRNIGEMTAALYGRARAQTHTNATASAADGVRLQVPHPVRARIVGGIMASVLVLLSSAVIVSMAQREGISGRTTTSQDVPSGTSASQASEPAIVALPSSAQTEKPVPLPASPLPRATEAATNALQPSKTPTVTGTPAVSKTRTLPPKPKTTRVLPSRTLPPATSKPTLPPASQLATAKPLLQSPTATLSPTARPQPPPATQLPTARPQPPPATQLPTARPQPPPATQLPTVAPQPSPATQTPKPDRTPLSTREPPPDS